MKKKLVCIILFILIAVSILSTDVFALTGSTTASVSSNTVVKGKEFTLTLSATSDSPIDGFYTKITYDTDVLKLKSKQSSTYADQGSGDIIHLTYNKEEEAPKTTTLCTITFEVLENTNKDKATISFSESELHLKNSGTLTEFKDFSITSVTVNIKSDETTAGGNGTSSDKSSDSESGSTPTDTIKVEEKDSSSSGSGSKSTSSSDSTKSSSTSSSSSSKSSSSSTKKLPQTGLDTTVVIAIVALTIFGIVSYISYRKYKKI